MANEDHEARPWPTARLVYSAAGLIGATAGTVLFLWLHPAANAAIETSLGRDPIPFLRALIAVLLLGWGVLLLMLPQLEAERLGLFGWIITMVVILCAGAALAPRFPAAPAG